MFPISINSYNIEAQRAAFDAFNAFTADPTFINSAGTWQAFFPCIERLTETPKVLFEGYSTQAVKAVPCADTAFPHREDNFLMYVDPPSLSPPSTLKLPHESHGADNLVAHQSYHIVLTRLWMPRPSPLGTVSAKAFSRLVECLRCTHM